MKRTKSLLIGAALVAAFSVSVGAFQGTDSAPNWIHYQGRLTKPSGAVVADGTQSVNFKLMNEANGVVWEETKDITVKQGIFSTRLGYPGGLPTAAFNGQLRLRVTVGSTVLPDQDLGSVGYAIMSHSVVDGAITNAKLAADADSLAKVSGGRVVLTSNGLITKSDYIKMDFSGSGGGQFVFGTTPNVSELYIMGGNSANTGSASNLYVTGWNGTFLQNLALRANVTRTKGRLFVDNQTSANASPSLDLAIGDSDTGFNWAGDGALDFWSNGVAIATLRPDGFRVVSGTKNAVVETEDYGKRLLYCTEAADVRFTDEGNARLSNGYARIEVDPIFLQTIEGEFVVTLTPYGPSSLYVAERGDDFFTVKSMSGSKNVEFSWRLSAKRKGYADRRLEEDKN